MRIREDGKHAHRSETINEAAKFWDCNKTRAMVKSADFACRIHERIEAVLSRQDLTIRQKREIAEELSVPSIYEIETRDTISIHK